ncbi:uncharacterized protein YeaO (DUF488 family) [Halomonas fontilapidosi]|uniref:Uncharacterized protein YeaO (DUF488 family) n=1 Tax=Halomonas fontilapidosi TaxID=616675 RepID=A0A7W5H094_9GAMM|nr:DUF488 family protein [Halomonas fontilapidosi]MBB3185329.1 uncharacterized protein YeaO (DUF488 family) [Halomonas fontilapidosi]
MTVKPSMTIKLKRAFETPERKDGYRVLVDRLWPRGVSKAEARIDAWPKEVAPSDELRKAFHDGELGWDAFRRRYLAELKAHRETLRPLAERASRDTVTLVFAAKDAHHNNAVVLSQYLKMLRP